MPVKDSTIRLKLVGSTDVTTGIQALSKGVSAELENLRRTTKGGDSKIIAAAEKQFDRVIRASEDARTKSKSQNQIIAIQDEMNLRMGYLDELTKKEPALSKQAARAKIEIETAAQHQIAQIHAKEEEKARKQKDEAFAYRNKLKDEEFKATHTKQEADLRALRRWKAEELRIHRDDAELKQQINRTYAAKRDQLLNKPEKGSPDGFGAKMIIGGAVGVAMHGLTGSGEVGTLAGTTLSAALFGGPLIATGIASMQLVSMAIEEARRHRIAMVEISTQSKAEFRQSIQWASQLTDRPITAAGANFRNRAYSLKELLASRADEYKIEDAKRTWWDKNFGTGIRFDQERGIKLAADAEKMKELAAMTQASQFAEKLELGRREDDSALLERDAKAKAIIYKQDRETVELQNKQYDQLQKLRRTHEDYVDSLNAANEAGTLSAQQYSSRFRDANRLYSIEKDALNNAQAIEKETLDRQHAIEREEVSIGNQLKMTKAEIDYEKQGFAAEREILDARHRAAVELANLDPANPMKKASAITEKLAADVEFATRATRAFQETLAGVDSVAATAILRRKQEEFRVQAREANPQATEEEVEAEVQRATVAEYTLRTEQAMLDAKYESHRISKEELFVQQMIAANKAAQNDPALRKAIREQAESMILAETNATKYGLGVEREKIAFQQQYLIGQKTRLDMEKEIALASVPKQDRWRVEQEIAKTVEARHKLALQERFMSPVDQWRKERDDILEAERNGFITPERARHLLQVGVDSLINQPTGQFSTMASRWQDLQSAVLKPEDDTQRLLLEEFRGFRDEIQELRRIGFPIKG